MFSFHKYGGIHVYNLFSCICNKEVQFPTFSSLFMTGKKKLLF